jgi:type 2A phosphatase activator TIP41
MVKKLKPGEDMKVGVADAWQGSRTDCEFSKRILKPFDWTYCTDYHGTLIPEDENRSHERLQIEETDQKIDMDKLKQKDEILYYENVDLFEDELADHGIAQFSAKIRVMKSSFFVLLRYFLRIDNIKAMIIDTRYYHELNDNYILREHCVRESDLNKLTALSTEIIIDPVLMSQRLPIIEEKREKLLFPNHAPSS